MCHPLVIEVDINLDRLLPLLRDTVSAIFVDFGWAMGPVFGWGDVEEPRLGRLRMKMTFAFVRPGLNGGAMAGGKWLVQLGVPNVLGVVLLGELVVSSLQSALQGSAVMLQFHIFGANLFVVLRHLGDASAETLDLRLEIPLCRRFPSRGVPTGGMVLGIMAGLAWHSRMWGEEEAAGPNRGRSQRSW